MASRFGASTLHQRDSRSDLFRGYTGPGSDARNRPVSASPSRGYNNNSNNNNNGPGGGYGGYGGYAAAYPGSSSNNGTSSTPHGGGFRSATPNSKGQYSDAVLSELESQNDQQVDGILGKVRVLKDMTIAIGDEIRDSSALAEKMNDSFDQTRLRLRGTMNRMLLMAERTGVGWKVWVGFFLAVILLFSYVWLF